MLIMEFINFLPGFQHQPQSVSNNRHGKAYIPSHPSSLATETSYCVCAIKETDEVDCYRHFDLQRCRDSGGHGHP